VVIAECFTVHAPAKECKCIQFYVNHFTIEMSAIFPTGKFSQNFE